MIIKIYDRSNKEISDFTLLGTAGYKYNIKIYYSCDACGKMCDTHWDSIAKSEFNNIEYQICNSCRQKSSIVRDRYKNTCIDRYGENNSAKISSVREYNSKRQLGNREKAYSAVERTDRYRKKYEVEKSILSYTGVEGTDYVECKLCGKRGLYIDTRHLKKRHNITKGEYLKLFPNAEIVTTKKLEIQAGNGSVKCTHEYILPSKQKVILQGYESFTLDYLFSIGVKEDDLVIYPKIPKIYYYELGKHRYFPDLLIKSTNRIVETKSTYTLEREIDTNLLKRKACIDAGYDFSFFVFDNKHNLEVL